MLRLTDSILVGTRDFYLLSIPYPVTAYRIFMLTAALSRISKLPSAGMPFSALNE